MKIGLCHKLAVVSDTKKNEKVYFSPKILHKKCHFLIVSIILSKVRTQNIMSEVCFKFGEKSVFLFVSDITGMLETTPYFKYTL